MPITEFRRDFVEIPDGIKILATGVATARVRALRAGVQDYFERGKRIRELRTIEEVQRCASYLKSVPVVINHPREGIVKPSNINRLSKGLSQQGRFNNGWVDVDIAIDDRDAVSKIKTTHQQVSMGYFVTRIENSGTWVDEYGVMGEKGRSHEYDRVAIYKIPRDIFGELATEYDIFNHLAFVESARAGDQATFIEQDEAISDYAIDLRLDSNPVSFTLISEESKSMADNTIVTIDGSGVSIPSQSMPPIQELIRGADNLARNLSFNGETYTFSISGVERIVPKRLQEFVRDSADMMRDYACAMQDIAKASDYKGRMKDSKIDGVNYSVPEDASAMKKHVMDMLKNMKDEVAEKDSYLTTTKQRADRLADEVRTLKEESRNDSGAIQQDAMNLALEWMEEYEQGKPYYPEHTLPSLKDAAQDMSYFKKEAIKAQCDQMDKTEVERIGWTANAISAWSNDEVNRAFNDLLRFYPPQQGQRSQPRQDHKTQVREMATRRPRHLAQDMKLEGVGGSPRFLRRSAQDEKL